MSDDVNNRCDRKTDRASERATEEMRIPSFASASSVERASERETGPFYGAAAEAEVGPRS